VPVNPAQAEALAREVVARYAEAEQLLIKRLAIYLAGDVEAPDWVERKLAQVQAYRAQAEAVVAELEKEAVEGVSTALREAYARGGTAALKDLAGAKLAAGTEPLAAGALERLISETVSAVTATGPRILRSTVDAYRAVVAETAEAVLLGTQTRRQAAQQALNRFAERGVTGFVDSRGRGWNLESYTEMAMRTGALRAMRVGHTDRLQEAEQDLVIVSDSPSECDLCRDWEGQVLSISGNDRDHPSVEEAEGAGLFHPNCTHTLGIYLEGVTRPMSETENPELYEAEQKQRYLERKIRESKRVEAAALDETARKAAAAKVRARQAQLREYVAANDLKRLRYREQIGRAI
jgi:hypothetical protein